MVVARKEVQLMRIDFLDKWFVYKKENESYGVIHEFCERHGVRNQVIDEVAHLIHEAHQSPFAGLDLLGRLGYSRTAQQLKVSRTNLPEPYNTPSGYSGSDIESNTLRGNFAEILSAAIAERYFGHSTPILRLRYNPNRHQSMKGTDVLAFKSDSNGRYTGILVGECKWRKTDLTTALTEGLTDLKRESRGVPSSMEFVAGMLECSGEKGSSASIRQFASQIRAGQLQVPKQQVLFIATQSDSKWLSSTVKKYWDLNSPLEIVVVRFTDGLTEWIDNCFLKARAM